MFLGRSCPWKIVASAKAAEEVDQPSTTRKILNPRGMRTFMSPPRRPYGPARTMKLDRGLIIALSFVLLSFGSATYVSIAALNYLRLYPALDEMQNQMPYQVDKLSFVAGANYNESTLTAMISV